jgi:glycosyltransferase involved in cell wall biosynthesis
MACGLPVIVSNIPGNVDVIEHEKNGLLFTVDDPDSLTRNLISLLDQPNRRQQLGLTARQTIENYYSLEYVADRYITLYQELLSKAGEAQTMKKTKNENQRMSS